VLIFPKFENCDRCSHFDQSRKIGPHRSASKDTGGRQGLKIAVSGNTSQIPSDMGNKKGAESLLTLPFAFLKLHGLTF